MDSVNTKIGQGIAKEHTSIVNDKTFTASNMLGLSGGVSQFAKSENAQASQQVKNAEKTRINLFNERVPETLKKDKANRLNADKELTEVNVGLLQSLDKISTLLQTNGTKISFSFDNSLEKGAKTPVVIVTDQDSGKVIRQIPTEEVQKFAERVKELESGLPLLAGLVLDMQA